MHYAEAARAAAWRLHPTTLQIALIVDFSAARPGPTSSEKTVTHDSCKRTVFPLTIHMPSTSEYEGLINNDAWTTT